MAVAPLQFRVRASRVSPSQATQVDLKHLIDDLQVLAITNRRALAIVSRIAKVYADRSRSVLRASGD